MRSLFSNTYFRSSPVSLVPEQQLQAPIQCRINYFLPHYSHFPPLHHSLQQTFLFWLPATVQKQSCPVFLLIRTNRFKLPRVLNWTLCFLASLSIFFNILSIFELLALSASSTDSFIPWLDQLLTIVDRQSIHPSYLWRRVIFTTTL